MVDTFGTAADLQRFYDRHQWKSCFTRGIAVQRRGEPRVTREVNPLTRFGREGRLIDELLNRRLFLPAFLSVSLLSAQVNGESMAVLRAFAARRLPHFRDGLRSPVLKDWDMGFIKNTMAYKERMKLQFRDD